MKTRAVDPAYDTYDPNGIGVANGNFLGLPWVQAPRVVLLAVPFGVTVSYGTGTAGGPANVLEASRQLDVSVPGLGRPWEAGFAWRNLPLGTSDDGLATAREAVERCIARLERREAVMPSDIALVDAASERMLANVEAEVSRVLAAGQLPVLVGGEHAVSLGAFRACAKTGDFGILQVDAHMDLRVAYEGFRYSHASVMHNALAELPQLVRLTQVGIRDYCPQEQARVGAEAGRVRVFYDFDFQERLLLGTSFKTLVDEIIATLPQRVWISFDIDGLDPTLCPNTGTPVPGGLTFAQAQYLTRAVTDAGREVIGIDLVEVAPAPYEYEGSVAARLAYDMACRVLNADRGQGPEIREGDVEHQ